MEYLTLDNGSGLSREEHITALSLADLLQRANASPVAQVFVQSLPIAGVDGTMRNRLTNQVRAATRRSRPALCATCGRSRATWHRRTATATWW